LNAAGNADDFAFDNNGKTNAIEEDDLADGRQTVMVGIRN
jgi:hypothetical protein